MKDSEGTYELPKGGDAEFNRLDEQHRIWLLLLDGLLYPPEIKDKVEELIKMSDKPEILDVGCGSAIWGVQMAQEFPRASVIGLDLTPVGEREFPQNFSFQRHNLVEGLPAQYLAKFDIIHCRTVCAHVPDSQSLVNSMASCLKPGGLLLIADANMTIYDKNKKPLAPFTYNPSINIEENLKNSGGLSWHTGWLELFKRAVRPAAVTPLVMLVQRSELLRELMVKDQWLPYGWEGIGIEHGEELGELTLKDFLGFYGLSCALFEKLSDIPIEVRDALRIRGAEEMRTGKLYMGTWYVIATSTGVSK